MGGVNLNYIKWDISSIFKAGKNMNRSSENPFLPKREHNADIKYQNMSTRKKIEQFTYRMEICSYFKL